MSKLSLLLTLNIFNNFFNANFFIVHFEQVKEEVLQLSSCKNCDAIWTLISWFLSGANF